MPPTITPTVGRVVWYWDADQSVMDRKGQPFAAIITHVWSDSCVNLAVLGDGSFNIANYRPTSVMRASADSNITAMRWDWMPFQVGQAAKTEDATGKLAAQIERLAAHVGYVL